MLACTGPKQCCVVIFSILASYGAVGRPFTEKTPNSNLVAHPIHTPLKSSLPEGTIIPEGPLVSPLLYRKAFKINIPLKPKLIKRIQALHQKNRSAKRDAKYVQYYRQKHVPFIKSLNMLLDSLLDHSNDLPDTQGSASTTRNKVCKFNIEEIPRHTEPTGIPNSKNNTLEKSVNKRQQNSEEKQATTNSTRAQISGNPKNTTEATLGRAIPAKVFSAEVPLDATPSLPLLPATDSPGTGRADERHVHGSGSANNADNKGSISGDSGRAKNVSPVREARNISASIPEHTDGAPRNGTISSLSDTARGSGRGIGALGLSSSGNATVETDERNTKIGSDIEQFEVKNKIEVRGNKSKNGGKRIGSRLRGPLATIKEDPTEQSLQPNEVIGKSITVDPQCDSHDQQQPIGNCKKAEQNIEVTDTGVIDGTENGDILCNTTQDNPIEITGGYSNYSITDSKISIT